ncbi:MAG: hypothetical protein JWQ66_3717 [Mucilaginibacter sp.]|nr:hypothetical protein [Mucilaginibacter sp.]
MVTRNAIIICSPGDEQNYLAGAIRDTKLITLIGDFIGYLRIIAVIK